MDYDGTPLLMPRMIRTRQKGELINLCRPYMEDIGLECPTSRTLYKFLHFMRAGSQKTMKGINPFYDSCMTSFAELKEMVSKLSPWIQTNTAKALLSGISTAHSYIR